jgi:hypothetical protein
MAQFSMISGRHVIDSGNNYISEYMFIEHSHHAEGLVNPKVHALLKDY